MNEIVKYHNDLSNQIVIKTLNATELNVLMALCGKMRDKDTDEVIFNFHQLKELIKWDNNNNELFIKNLINMNKKLISLNFTFRENKRTTQFVLFPTFITDEINKTLTVRVNKDFSFLLNNISSNFTRFELDNFTDLKSKYSKYLYKELMKFKTTGYLILTIDDFRNKLDIPNSYKMINIDKRVLEPIKEELTKILKNFEINKIKKGRSIDRIEFSFTPIKDNEKIKEAETIEICEIEQYWLDNFPGVNYTLKHKKIIDKLKKNNSIAYIKSYLQEQWDFVKNNAAIENRPAYFSQLILGEKAVFKDYESLNKKVDIDPEEDKIQAENFVGTLFENIGNNIINQDEEIKENIEIEQPALFLTEITQEEYDFLYQKYLENNELKDNNIQRNIFKMMNFNKYKIVEKKEVKKVYTVDDIPAEKLLSKNGKKLVGAALQMKINKILEEMNK